MHQKHRQECEKHLTSSTVGPWSTEPRPSDPSLPEVGAEQIDPEVSWSEADTPPRASDLKPHGVRARFRRYLSGLSRPGEVVAVAFLCMSLTPSLLPRPWYLQSVASGLSVLAGYGFGVLGAWICRVCGLRVSWSSTTRRRVWYGLLGLCAAATVLFLIFGDIWQGRARQLVGVEIDASYYAGLTMLLAWTIAVALLGLFRFLRRCTRWLTKRVGRWIPAPIAKIVGVVLVGAVVVFLLNGVLYRGFLAVMNTIASATDQGSADGITPPTAPERSGSPGSPMALNSLGYEGRTFVSIGPTVDQLTAFNGTPATTPIRVYAGASSADTLEGVADNVVAELRRTGAFNRAVLALANTTGTGWVNPSLADPIEYLFNGDTAIAGMQYSFLPSWAAFVADRATPQHAGRVLLEKVYAAWSSLPENNRPRLVVFGESLGSFAGQSGFSGIQDMQARIDGAVWSGTPNFTDLWTTVTANRDPGSLQREPIIDSGAAVRFANEPSDLALHGEPWATGSRIVYQQHATDPVVWWSSNLLFSKPDWLNEPVGPDVNPAIDWYPVVTFWQLTIDMMLSSGVPAGHGHHYGPECVDSWVTVLQPPNWTDTDTAHLRDIITG